MVRIGLVAAFAILLAAPVQASTLPHADFGTRPIVGAGFGADRALTAGGSLSLDWPIAERLSLGGALGASFSGGLNYDVRGLYRLVEGGPEGPAIAGMIGLWGAPGLAGFQLPVAVAPVLGFAAAYTINPSWDVRLNLSYAPFFAYGSSEYLSFIGGPSLSGIEVAYRVRPNVQATLGVNGRGDVLGLSASF